MVSAVASHPASTGVSKSELLDREASSFPGPHKLNLKHTLPPFFLYAGVSKSELLDREAGDLAVRMALGETHVIAETKRALGEAGELGWEGG